MSDIRMSLIYPLVIFTGFSMLVNTFNILGKIPTKEGLYLFGAIAMYFSWLIVYFTFLKKED